MNLGKGLLLGIAGTTAFAAGSASGAELASWQFVGGDTLPTYVDASLDSASAMGIGTWDNGYDPLVGAYDTGAYGVYVKTLWTGTGANSLADAQSTDDYLKFTIDGLSFDVGQISFDYWMGGTTDTSSYSAYILTSETGTTVLGSATITQANPESNRVTVTADTTGVAALQGLSGPVDIFIYLSDNTSANYLQWVDDVSINSTPEPGTLALMGVGALCMTRRRRRA